MFKNDKFTKKVALYLLCTVFICYSIAGMIISSSGFKFNSLFNNMNHNINMGYEIDEQNTLSISAINNIRIEMVSADIKISLSNDDNVKATLRGRIQSSQQISGSRLDMTKQGDIIYIKSPSKFFTDSYSYSENLTLEVFIPKSYSNSLDIRTTSSDTYINTLNLNSLNMSTVSGTIKAEEISAKSFNFASTSGDLIVNKLKSSNNQIKTTSGEIKINSIEGDLSFNSTSGDCYLSYNNMPDGNIDISSISGEIQLLTPSNAEFFVNASSTSGDVKLSKPIIAEMKKEHQVRGVVGSDKCRINIKTTSGDIIIK